MATQNLHVLSSFLAKTSGNAQGLEKHAFLERLVHLLQYNLAFGWQTRGMVANGKGSCH